MLAKLTSSAVLSSAVALAQTADVTFLETWIGGEDIPLAVSSDGDVVTGSGFGILNPDRAVLIWTRRGGRFAREVVLDTWCDDNEGRVTPGGRWVMVHSQCSGRSFGSTLDLETNTLTRQVGFIAPFERFQGISADGSVVLVDYTDPHNTNVCGFSVTTVTGSILVDGNMLFGTQPCVGGVALSSDGHTVLCQEQSGSPRRAFLWSLAGGVVDVAASPNDVVATAMNTDGSWVVGTRGGVPFRWHPTMGATDHPGLPLGPVELTHVSDDGQTVLARAPSAGGQTEWYIWREGFGWELAIDLLDAMGAPDLVGMDLGSFSMSADGKSFAGLALRFTPQGHRPFVARLDGPTDHPFGQLVCVPSPTSPELHVFGDEVVGTRDLRLVVTGLPAGQTGLFLAGSAWAPYLLPGSAQPTCIGGRLYRAGPTPFTADADGTARTNVDMRDPYYVAGLASLFQAWYQEPSSTGGTVSKFSTARYVELR